MKAFSKGRYSARVTTSSRDIEAAQQLRYRAFTQVGWPTDAQAAGSGWPCSGLYAHTD